MHKEDCGRFAEDRASKRHHNGPRMTAESPEYPYGNLLITLRVMD